MNSIVCDCKWLSISIHIFRRITWVNSRPIPGFLPVPVAHQLVTYIRTDVHAPSPWVHCSCRQQSLCCTVCTTRETELWSHLWNPCWQTGRWLTTWKQAMYNSRTIKQACVHTQVEESVTILNLMWHMCSFPRLLKRHGASFSSEQGTSGVPVLSVFWCSCCNEAASSPQHPQCWSAQWKKVEGTFCTTTWLLQWLLLQSRSELKNILSLHLNPLLPLCRTVPKPCIGLDSAVPNFFFWNGSWRGARAVVPERAREGVQSCLSCSWIFFSFTEKKITLISRESKLIFIL